MYIKSQVLSCFGNLVGWKESHACGDDTLDAALLDSDSELYVNGLPGITFPIITETLEDWQGTLNQYLLKIHEEETYFILNRFVNGLKQHIATKELLANNPLISGVVDTADATTPAGRFVGFMFKPRVSNNIITAIKHIGLQLSAAQTVRIFLYETSQVAAVATYDFNYTLAKSNMWKEVTDWWINFQSLTSGSGQTYLFGYYETVAAHPAAWQMSGTGYYTDFDCCSNTKLWQRWVSAHAIEIPTTDLNWNAVTSTFDLPVITDLDSYQVDQTHGLNAKINCTCDITQVICHNRFMFAEPLQLSIAKRVLQDAIASSRFNAIAEVKRKQCQMFYEQYKRMLEGGYFGIGDNVKYDKGILANLELDFSDIDKVCLKRLPEIQIERKVRQGDNYGENVTAIIV